MTTSDTVPRISVKWHSVLGGWAMECLVCGAQALRDEWETALAEADRHQAAHVKLGWLT